MILDNINQYLTIWDIINQYLTISSNITIYLAISSGLCCSETFWIIISRLLTDQHERVIEELSLLKMENNGENSGPLLSLLVDRLQRRPLVPISGPPVVSHKEFFI